MIFTIEDIVDFPLEHSSKATFCFVNSTSSIQKHIKGAIMTQKFTGGYMMPISLGTICQIMYISLQYHKEFHPQYSISPIFMIINIPSFRCSQNSLCFLPDSPITYLPFTIPLAIAFHLSPPGTTWLSSDFKYNVVALAGIAQWIEHRLRTKGSPV